MNHHLLDLEALLRVPYVDPYGGFGLAPDGNRVAFSWNRSGQWEIYVIPLDRSALATDPTASAPRSRQITAGAGAKFAPRWSPHGQRLAYALDLDGGEQYDIYVYDFDSGQHLNLTPDIAGAIQPNFCWSHDGRWIAFISDCSGHFDTFVMPATGGRARPVLSLPYPDWDVRWSPDGRWLAVVSVTRGQDYGTFIVPIESEKASSGQLGNVRAITDHGSAICAKGARWSPDSQRVAFASDLYGSFNLGLYELATGRVTWVTEGEGDKEWPAWSPDGQRLAYVVSHGPVTELAVLELENGGGNSFRVEQGVHYQPCFTLDGAHLLAVFDNPGRPCDLWMLSLRDGSFRELTRSLPSDLQDAPFAMPTQVRYPSLDGETVPALLYHPRPDEMSPPAVVYVHGGPNWLTQVTWDPLLQHMVSRGWLVLAPNYRGSTGYGRDWQLANRFDLGGGDTQDVVAGADYLVREGMADPRRIAVTGRSWGGYLTMTCLTQYPGRWAAGSAAVPFLNWFTAHANSRADLQHWDVENMGDPEERHDLWFERSPFFFLDRVTAPVQLICGAHDVRCPASESFQAHEALVAQGKDCELVLYPGEGHAFLKTKNQVDAKRRRVAFLAQHLEKKDSAQGQR